MKYTLYLVIALGAPEDAERARCLLVELEDAQRNYYSERGVTELDPGPFQRLTSECVGPYEHRVKETLFKRMVEKRVPKRIRAKGRNVRLRNVQGRTIRIYEDEENACSSKGKKLCDFPCYWDRSENACFEIPKGTYRPGRGTDEDDENPIEIEGVKRTEGESEIYEL